MPNARAGYRVFFNSLCPLNVSIPFGRLYQGPDRAKLRAAVHVLESTPTGAKLLHIKSVNKAVVDGFGPIELAGYWFKAPDFQSQPRPLGEGRCGAACEKR